MRFLSPRSDKNAVMDYSAALASAVAWLGNRYLLARPAGRLTPEERRGANLGAERGVQRQL
jgi:hypothetical protein